MLPWVSLLKILLTLASKVADVIETKNLMDAGEARANAASLRALNDSVRNAIRAMGDGSVRDDEYRD